MNKKSILLLGVVLTVSLLAIGCKKTLTGKEATEALDIESQTPDIDSLQYLVTIKNKTSNNVKGRVRVICDIYPKTRGDVRVLGEVNDIAEDLWAPNSSKSFKFPIKRNYPITSEFELHAHLENP